MATSARNLSILTGIITHAHRCESSVRVRVMKQTWNKKLRKFFSHPIGFLADDHAKACVAGDVVRVACGHLRTSSTKRHVVDAIVAPARTGTVRTEPEGVHGWLVRQNERRNIKWAKKVEAEKVAAAKIVPVDATAEGKVKREIHEQRGREWEAMTKEEKDAVMRAAHEARLERKRVRAESGVEAEEQMALRKKEVRALRPKVKKESKEVQAKRRAEWELMTEEQREVVRKAAMEAHRERNKAWYEAKEALAKETVV